MGDVRLAGQALLALVGRGAELGGFADALHLLGRQVGLDVAQQLLEARSASVRREAVPGAKTHSPWASLKAGGGLSVSEAELRRAEASIAQLRPSVMVSGGGGSGSRSISAVMLPAAISRRATTVGLSFSQLQRGLGAIGQAAGALGGQQHELEEVIDVVQAVFDGNSGHGVRKLWKCPRPAGERDRNYKRQSGIQASFSAVASQRLAAAQQVSQQRGQGRALRFERRCRRLSTMRHEVVHGALEVVVDDHVVELVPVGHIADGVAQAAGDDLVRVGLAVAQALLEGLRARAAG